MASWKKSRYSRAERRAYESGKGYRVARENRGINFKNPKNRASFQAGYAAAGKSLKKNSSKYPKLGN